MTKEEALKLSMEAMEITGGFDVEINAIKEALAQPEHEWVRGECVKCGQSMEQPEQEPVAWVCHGTHGHHDIDFFEDDVDALSVGTKLYTTPPQRKPLKDEEIADLYFDKFSMGELKAFARAIEAAHGIKGEA